MRAVPKTHACLEIPSAKQIRMYSKGSVMKIRTGQSLQRPRRILGGEARISSQRLHRGDPEPKPGAERPGAAPRQHLQQRAPHGSSATDRSSANESLRLWNNRSGCSRLRSQRVGGVPRRKRATRAQRTRARKRAWIAIVMTNHRHRSLPPHLGRRESRMHRRFARQRSP